MIITSPRRAPFGTLFAGLAGVTAMALVAGCSSSAAHGAAASGGGNRTQASGTGQARGGTGFGPGAAASGEIAQIAGRTMQVQSTSAQTAVTYSGSTRFTITRSTTPAAVKVGVCVVATAAPSSPSSASSSGSAASSPAVPVTATAIRVSPARSGSCDAGGFGGAGRARPSGTNRPSGMPTYRPSGAAGGGRGFGGFAAGKVIAVSGSTITVTMAARAASGSTARTTTRTIKVTSATKYTTTATTTGTAAKVGLCAVVQGKTDSRGAVAATAIALSSKVGGTCTAAGRSFPGGGRGPGGGNGAPPAPGGTGG